MTGKPHVPVPYPLLQARRDFFMQIRHEVESINLAFAHQKIVDVDDGTLLTELTAENLINSQRMISTVLSDLQPGSVLDIGQDIHGIDNSLLAARCGSQVVAVNPDETSVKKLYVVAKNNNFPILGEYSISFYKIIQSMGSLI